jgi:hypothetical protein
MGSASPLGILLGLPGKMLGAGFGNPALGFIVAWHDCPTLRFDIAASVPRSYFVGTVFHSHVARA